MNRFFVIPLVIILLSGLILGGCAAPAPTPAPTPTLVPTPTPAPSPSPVPTTTQRPKPNITLPADKGAFYGRVMWGDSPVSNSTVIAKTQQPIIIFTEEPGLQFTVNTDNDGNYVLIVDPGEYYLGCSLPNASYFTYESFGSALILALSTKISAGEFILKDLEAMDWSIKLVSPGSSQSISHPPLPSENAIIVNSTPTLSWQEYNWQNYSTEQNYRGYYMIHVWLYSNESGYYIVESGKSSGTSYSVVNPLQKGEYFWEVRAYSKSGKEIAGTEEEFYFVVP